MKCQVAAQSRQMLTSVSSMQLDVDTLHSLLIAHFQEVVAHVLFVPVCASLSVSFPVPASKLLPSAAVSLLRSSLAVPSDEKTLTAAGILPQISMAVAQRKVWRLSRSTQAPPNRAFEWDQAEF